jgi:sulfite reductase (NADPH) flavoprotein alpha-component
MAVSAAENLIEDQLRKKADAFLKELSRDQLLWLSGYVMAHIKHSGADVVPAKPHQKVLIAYGTETGNSQSIAEELATVFEAQQFPYELKNLSSLRARHLTGYQFIFIICSTHGDGDPPEPVHLFYTSLMDENAPRLSDVRYAVLALGDSSYPHFCATGKEIDDRLAGLGATRVLFRQDCDVDYADTAKQWIESLSGQLASKLQPAVVMTDATPSSDTSATEISRESPLETEVIENIRLSASSREDVVHHMEIASHENMMHLKPGDAIGVLAENPEPLVDMLLQLTGADEAADILVRRKRMPLRQALLSECDISIPGNKLLTTWGRLSKDKDLQQLLTSNERTLKGFLRSNQVIDILRRFPARPDAQTLVDALKPLQPRLYDLANSQQYTSGEMHILVKRYLYTINAQTHAGIASDYLVNRKVGSRVRLFPYINNRFRLSCETDDPVIYISEGTGIGPFRALLQDMAHHDKKKRCWLFLSENSFEEDFLYQTEWQTAYAEKRLDRIDTIFTEKNKRASAIKKLLEQKEQELLDYLDAGAHIYLCGDRAILTEVETVLQRIMELDPAAMQKSDRVHRNFY